MPAMAEDPFLPFVEGVTKIVDELEKLEKLEKLEMYTDVDRLKFIQKLIRSYQWLSNYSEDNFERQLGYFRKLVDDLTSRLAEFFRQILTSLSSKEEQPPRIGGRRIADAVVVSAVVLLSFVYHYLVGYIDRGGSKAGSSSSLDFRDIYISRLRSIIYIVHYLYRPIYPISISSSSLDFRDIYISIVLFQAAYVWIKFRDVIPRGAVYRRPNSDKWEPRIKYPVTRGVGCKSKRIPLGLYDTLAEGEVAYRIAAFYCKKRKHSGRLDLGGGAYFPIPALSMDPILPYEEKVKQVGDQVLKVYAEFEEQKASRNLPPPRVSGLALEMSTGEGQLLTTSPIQQLRQPLNSGLDSAMQGQGSQFGLSIHNGVDFSNPGDLLPVLLKTQHELLGAYKQQECLKAEVSRTEVESMGWEVKYSELNRKYSELEHENGLLNHQIMQLQSQLQIQHEEQEFDPDRLFSMEHEESLAR